MNTKGTKFLAVLAVLAMAFAAVAVVGDYDPIAADPEPEPEDPILSLSGELKYSQVLTTDAKVVGEFTIPEGLTLTVSKNIQLILDADLCVKGTLVIEPKGEIVCGEDNGGDIIISKGAVIDAKGYIGKEKEITISDDHEDEDENEAATVTIVGVQGMSFSTVSIVTGVDNEGKDIKEDFLAISGAVNVIGGLKADADKKVEIAGAYINGDLTIGKGIVATVAATVMKDTTFEMKGLLSGEDNNITLECGATYIASDAKNVLVDEDSEDTLEYGIEICALSGYIASGKKIVALEGDVEKEDPDSEVSEPVSLTMTNMKDYVVSVKKFSVPSTDGEKTYKYQSMFVSGVAAVNGADLVGGIEYADADDLTRTDAQYSYLFVDGIFEIPKDVDVTIEGLNVEKAGMLIIDATEANTAIDYVGAYYQMENLNGDLDTYYTTFADAFAMIDAAEDMTVKIAGIMEINNSYAILADQTVTEVPGSAITIGYDAVITVENDAVFNALLDADNGDKIEGKVIVKEFGSCTPEEGTYAVSKIDEATYTYIYSGLAIALAEAQAGDVIDVVTETTVDESLTVKEGVTLNLKDDVTVKGSLYIKEGAIVNVEKTLTVGDLEKDSKIDVQGKLDASKDGASIEAATGAGDSPAVANVALYSTGETIVATEPVEIDVNAATYTNDDGDIIYTTVAQAISALEEDETVIVLGDVTEKGAIDAKGVDILVKGTFSFDILNLEGAKISCDAAAVGAGDCYYSGKVCGLNGVGDATAATAIVVDKMQNAIESKVTENYEEVNEYKMMIYGITGKVVIESGVVSTAEGFTIDGDKFEIKSGAEFVINVAGVFISGNNIEAIIDGKMTIDGVEATFGAASVDKYPVVTGTIFITNGAKLTASCLQIIGAVVVDSEDDGNEFIIANGGVVLGQTTKDINAINAQIVGKTTINAGAYIISSVTADLSKAEFNDDVVMTTYSVNGVDAVKALANKDAFPIWAPEDATMGAVYKFVFEYFLEPIGGLAWPTTDGEIDLTKIVWKNANDKKVNTDTIGSVEAVFAEIDISKASILVSPITGVSIFVDGVKCAGDSTFYAGAHIVTAQLEPGYEGEFTIYFDGVEIANGGSIIIDDEMTPADDVLSVVGEITIAKDKGMSITEILLIVLVVLIAIMAVIVALRLNRS